MALRKPKVLLSYQKRQVQLIRERHKDLFWPCMQSIAILLSPLAMTPLTNLFLSKNAPFDCKGFSFVCASFAVAISLCFASMLKPNTSNQPSEVDAENAEAPFLS
ncbi:unnamed protein product [Coffea canephora]|uniref:DH200=94 genomic scaffold, scaffold_1268 n=1 Tax=Coffea canephora TaxID=49390 RepID=A0A068VIE7_COFCA|nr:unnamed protein product [Coffea canephora]